MAEAAKVTKLPQSPQQLIDKIISDEVERGGCDIECCKATFIRLIQGRHKAKLQIALREYFDFVKDGKRLKPSKVSPPKPLKGSKGEAAERELKRHESAMRRIEREQEAIAYVLTIHADCTLHQLWAIGNKFGKKGDRRKVFDVYSRRELEGAGIAKE